MRHSLLISALLLLPFTAQAEVVVASIAPNMCLDANQNSNVVALWACNGGANQNFFTSSYGQQNFNGRCLDQATPKQGAGLVMVTCVNGKASQRWSMVGNPNDSNALGSLRNESGWCANIPGGYAAQGVQVIVWTCPSKNATGRRNDVWGRGISTTASGARLSPSIAAQMNQVGNIVAQGGGNIVAQGGGNIVAQGGGNIVSQGGGNVIVVSGGGVMRR